MAAVRSLIPFGRKKSKDNPAVLQEVKQQLRSQLFSGDDVQIVVRLKKKGKKKKKEKRYLAVVVSQGSRAIVYKIHAPAVGTFTIKKSWKLQDLKQIEKSDEHGAFLFTVVFDKTYTWATPTPSERSEIVLGLLQLYQKLFNDKPKTSIDLLEQRLMGAEIGKAAVTDDISTKTLLLLSPAEEKELEAQLRSAVGETDIHKLTETLTEKVNALETANIREIIMADSLIRDLVNRLDDAARQLEQVDGWLNEYNMQLGNMKRYIEQIEQKNNRLDIGKRNKERLLHEVSDIIDKLRLDSATEEVLKAPKLSTNDGLRKAIRAADALDSLFRSAKAMRTESSTAAVRERLSRYQALQKTFTEAVEAYLLDIFKKLSPPSGLVVDLSAFHSNRERVPWHRPATQNLLNYAPLVRWIYANNRTVHDHIMKGYAAAAGVLYKREMRAYLDQRNELLKREHRSSTLLAFGSTVGAVGMVSQIAARTERSVEGDKKTVDQLFAEIINEIFNVVLDEEEFCTDFLMPNDRSVAEKMRKHDLTELIVLIFDKVGLDSELKTFVNEAFEMERFTPISMLHDVEFYLEKLKTTYTDASDFLPRLLQAIQQQLSELFSRFIDDEIATIRRASPPSLKRCGVLPFFARFPAFVDRMLHFVVDNDRKYVDPQLTRMVTELFAWLLQITGDGTAPASASAISPAQLREQQKYKHIVRLENYYHFWKQMSRRDVKVLAAQITEAEEAYLANLRAYSEQSLKKNKGLQPLVTFFSEIDEMLKRMGPEEIRFQASYNAAAFSRIAAKAYPAAVDKALLKLYKRTTRAVSTELGLLSTVWRDQADLLIGWWRHWEDIATVCYKQQMPLSSQELQRKLESLEKTGNLN